MNPWKNVHKFDGWSTPLLITVLLAGCESEAPSFSVRRGAEVVLQDGGGSVSSNTVTSQTATVVDDGGSAPAGFEADSGANGTDTPPLGCGSDVGSDVDSDCESEPALPWNGAPLYSHYVRLTHQQWENSIVANLRLDAPTGFLTMLAPDVVGGYSNNEEMLRVGGALVTDYQAAAASIAERVTADAEALSNVSASREPETFIAEVGRRFYRRPLASAELATYLALYETGAGLAAAGQDDFAAGVQLLLEVWMQAPSFIYRVEQSEGLLNGYEMATRLAYLLTDTTPSEALLAAAEAGELDSAAGVAQAAEELLATPQATLVFRRFHDETFWLGALETLQFADSFGLPSDLGSTLREAAHAFFDRQFREQLGLRELFLSQTAFVNTELAGLYDVSAPSTDALEAFTLGASRRGVFAQLPFLILSSHDETPNAFRRGALFTKHVLCQELVQLPSVQPVPPTPEPGLTNRERSSQLVASEACMTCHQYIDPFGFAFENFDGLGRERTQDNGLPVDTTGTYPFATTKQFANSTELMAILAESPLVHDCYAKHLTEFALGRTLTEADAALVAQLGALSLSQDEPLTGLVEALAASETFRSSGATP